MDFSFTKDQEHIRSKISELAKSIPSDSLVQNDFHSTFEPAIWKRVADAGMFKGFAPKEYGGENWDIIARVSALEAFGYECRDNGLALGISSLVWTILPPILTMGSEQQKIEYIPKLISGELIAADGITEPEAGSDAMSMKTTATKTECGYVLSGEKCLIGFAPIADLILVFAKTDTTAGPWGISAFLVDSNSKGLIRSGNREKMGLRTLPTGDLSFDQCFVPESSRLGPEGVGLSLFNESMEWERSFILAPQVGAMARQLDECIAYAKSRKQFGKSIGTFQSISNRIADMRLRLETSRGLLYKAAWLKNEGRSAAMEASLANLHIAESFLASSQDAIRIHGGKGYLSEYGIERDLRDAMGGVIYAGTSDIQRNMIARLLGLY